MNALKIEYNTAIGLLIHRITIGILILFHGIANMSSGYTFIKGLLKSYQIPDFLAYGVFIGEIMAPILIIIGYRTRSGSLLITFNFLMAILLAHTSEIFSLNQFGGWAIELQVLYLVGALTLFFTGAGKYAVSISSIWD